MELAVEKIWPKNTDLSELWVSRHSGVSSAKRCLVAGAVDVDMAAPPGRAKNVGQCVLPSLQPCFQPSGIRSRVQKTCGNGA